MPVDRGVLAFLYAAGKMIRWVAAASEPTPDQTFARSRGIRRRA
jgi:hypothetical protein